MSARKPEIAVRGLARLARDGASGTVSREEHAEGRARLLAAVEKAAPPRARGRLGLVLAAAALLLLIGAIFLRRPAAPLSFTVDGAPQREGYLRAGPAGVAARFSEGTVVALAPGARGRVVDVGARGARLSLEAGSARFDVVHRPGSAWVVEAGPFTVTVTGTAFDLSWSGTRVEIVMAAGSVVVHGPPAPDGLVLRAGQRLVADAARAEVSLVTAPQGSLDAPPGARSASATPEPPASATAPSGAVAPSSPPAPAKETAPSWPARVAAGDFAGVLADAEARGVDAAIEATSLADLAALADAARYAGRTELARRALVAERTRFPGSAEARSAAFLLGRMADGSSPATAVTWYDRYLVEAPGGSLAAEALGRKMLAQKASAGRDAARPAAEEYRRRYPAGPFAPAAAEIMGEP